MDKRSARTTLARAAFGIGWGLFGCAALAQWTPTERITFVSHSSPGTGNDLMLREIADIWVKNKLAPKLVTVENVTGSQGEKARRFVGVQNKGNTHLLMAFTPPVLNTPLLLKSELTAKTFTPIAMLAVEPVVLLVNAESPYRSLKELIEAARQKPKQILQGGGSYGNSASMAGRMLADHAGVQFSYTPFKGGGEAVVQLLGNHVHFVLENPSETEQHVKAGKLLALAVSEPLEQFPDAPTFAKAGYELRLLRQFRGLLAPPGIPPDVQAFYIRTLERTRQTPQWRQYLKKTALSEYWLAGAELTTFIDEEQKDYARLNREMGLVK